MTMDLSLILGLSCGAGVGIICIAVFALCKYCLSKKNEEEEEDGDEGGKADIDETTFSPNASTPFAGQKSSSFLPLSHQSTGCSHSQPAADICSLGGHSNDSSADSGEFDAHVGGIHPDWYQRQGSLQESDVSKPSHGRIHLRLQHDVTTSTLMVNVIEGQDLFSSEVANDLRDSCIRVLLVPETDAILRQTPFRRKAPRQIYNDFFKMPLTVEQARDTTLCVQLYDVDRISRSTLTGELKLRLWEQTMDKDTDIWHDIAQPKKVVQSLGEIQLSLSYLPTAERMTIVVAKAIDLRPAELTGNPDPFVEVSLIKDKKIIKKKKTSVKLGTTSPVWNEALVFNVPTEILPKVSLVVTVFDQDLVGHCEVLGHCGIGAGHSKAGKRHWQEMIHSFRKTVTLWHPLYL